VSRSGGYMVLAFICAVLVSGCASSVTSADTASTQTLVSGGVTRSYRLYEPASPPAGKLALMVALHAGYSSAAGMESLTGFDGLADKDGFLVAYPEAENGIWHLGCCNAERSSPDDVEFISALIGHLVATANVDPSRVYVTGFSVGAGMAYRLACELSSQVVGMGSVGGYEYLSKPCAPQHPVTIYEIHGTKDYYGGSCGGTTESDEGCGFGDPGYIPSVLQLNEQWRRADGCPATALATTAGVIAEQTWEPCLDGSGVRLDTIENGTHCWPTVTTCGDFDASLTLWNFLSSHPRPVAAGGGEAPGEEPPAGKEHSSGEETPSKEEAPAGSETPTGKETPAGKETPLGEKTLPGEEAPLDGTTSSLGTGGDDGSSAGAPSSPAATGGVSSSSADRKPGSGARGRAPRCRVPSLLGRTESAARRLLRGAGCRIGTVTRLAVGGGAGRVVRLQHPGAGAELRGGARVSFTLGRRR
jgi:polyhydroxybutyrate depolymerase